MGEVAERVRAAVERIRVASEAEGLDLGLRPPATPEAVDAAEAVYGLPFPEAVREFYLIADGQHGDPRVTPLLCEWPVPPLRRALAECLQWREFLSVTVDEEVASLGHEDPDPEVAPAAWHMRWFPFGFWQGSEMLIVDQAPTDAGVSGQLIINGSHVFEGPPWVAPGLMELLEALAEGIAAGLVGLRRHGVFAGGTRWSVGPAGMPLEYNGRVLFDDPSPVGSRLDALPGEWRDWVDARGSRFKSLFGAAPGLVAVPPDTRDLTPLRLFPELRWLDLSATQVDDLTLLPDLPELSGLVVRGLRSLQGIDRFPLSSLIIRDSPGIDLSALADARGPIRLEIDGPWVGDAPADRCGSVVARVGSRADAQRVFDLRPSMLQLFVDDVDVADLDWSVLNARQVDIIGVE